MKKTKILLVISLIVISSIYIFIDRKKKYISPDDILGIYVNDELSAKIPSKNEALFQKAICDDDVSASWDNDAWGLLISNLSRKVKCNLYFYSGQTVFNFDYTGGEQTFTAPISGTYRLETWGSQGGSGVNKNTDYGNNDYSLREGGYGGYASGIFKLEKSSKKFINVGGGGTTLLDISSQEKIIPQGYNGGGAGFGYANGGGATHIGSKSGLLNTLQNNRLDILIVAGGGAGAAAHIEGGGFCIGGSGGGYIGNNGANGSSLLDNPNLAYINLKPGVGANQSTGYSFGLGESANSSHTNSGAGGGYYGGKISEAVNSWNSCGGGGSGYIGNPLLTNKAMYCYNCEESDEESTKTISTTCS